MSMSPTLSFRRTFRGQFITEKRSHPGQAKASRRKREKIRLRDKERTAAAKAAGITIAELLSRRAAEGEAVVAAHEAARERFAREARERAEGRRR